MRDVDKTEEQLIGELQNASRRIAELEALEESQRRNEHELRQNERRYRLFAENIADVIWIVHARSPDQLVYINPSVTRFLGYGINELMTKTMEEVFTPESVQVIRKTLAEEFAVENKGQQDLTRSRTLELETIHRNGTVIPIEAIYSFLPGHENHPAEILVVARDIRVRKQAEEEIKRNTEKQIKAMEATMQAMAMIIEVRDPYTAGHQKRVTQLACAIAKELGLSPDQIIGLRLAGIVHDIGKVRVPSKILTNPDGLSSAERTIVRAHPLLGYEILKTLDLPWPIAEIVHQHHERIDGSGYPSGLSGENIILEARILAVADVAEVISSHRPYRPAGGVGKALEEISQKRGILYDSRVVDIVLKLFTEQGFKFEQ